MTIRDLIVDHNNVATLSPVRQLSTLEMLYISNNNLTQLTELQFLRDLPKLTALGCQDNPLSVSGDEYRNFGVYYLPQVRILDDVSSKHRRQSMYTAYNQNLVLFLFSSNFFKKPCWQYFFQLCFNHLVV